MIKNAKLMNLVVCILWALTVFSFFATEAIRFNSEIWMVIGIVLVVFLVVFHSYFLYIYFSTRKKVEALQDQYIETLKPSAPLRFCPSDEELMQKYNEHEIVVDSYAKEEIKTEEKTHLSEDEDEIVIG